MKHIRYAAALLALLLLLAAFAGCGASPSPSPAPSSEAPAPSSSPAPEAPSAPEEEPAAITFTDMTGREITLDGPAARIVALTPADCEILYALGAGEALVGRGEYCDYPPEVLEVPSVQSGSEANLEQILALAPDAIVMGTMDHTKEQIAAMEDAGIAVIVSDADDIAGTYLSIEVLGKALAKEEEAAALVASMKEAFTEIESKAAAAADSEKTVYFEVSPLQYGLWTAGTSTFMDELCTMLGVKNAFPDVEGWAEISEEQILERDPDYIVTITMYFGEGPTPVEEILSRPGWGNLKAVVNGDILNADSNAISRPGPRLVDAAQALYDFIYSE